MGQRSQIYIRIADEYNENSVLYAKYYSWNFGERMISRARHGIEYIKDNLKHISLDTVQEKINRIFDVNFDMHDILLTSNIIREWIEDFAESYEAKEYIFECIANNDGKLFVDVTKEGEIKYCFTDYNLKILNPRQYMNWDFEGWKKGEYLSKEEIDICENNIKYINSNAKLMTKEELQEFINYDYSKQICDLAEKLKVEIPLDRLRSNEIEKDVSDCEVELT